MADKEITVELPESVTKALEKVEALEQELIALKGTKPEEKDLTGITDLDGAQKEYARVETELAKARQALRSELEERTKELEASKAEVVKVNRQRRRERFIKLAQALPNLPGTMADDFGELLDDVEAGLAKVDGQTAKKRFEKFYTLLTSWNTVIEKNNLLMQEIGRDGGELGFLSGPEAQIEALAREKVSHDPKLSIEKARTQVISENPALYRKYQRENGGK